MKHGWTFVLIIAVTVGWFNNHGPGSELLRDGWRRFTLPFRYAQMLSQPADETLPVPVQGVRVSQVANTWHAPRGNRRHEGLDIFAPRSTPVLSATYGFIANIGENNLGGQTVSVIGPGGRYYYYAHLDSYAADISIGDEIPAGTILGFVGTTGNARGTPPHLHFGVYGPSGAINPHALLRD